MNQDAKSRCQIEEIRYLRGMAILAVIGMHVIAYYTKIDKQSALLFGAVPLDTALHFAVPMFTLISGAVLSLRYQARPRLWPFYRRRFLSVFPPYLFASLIYLAIFDFAVRPINLTRTVLKIASATTFYHMWFIAVIFQLYLLYPVLRSWYRRFERKGRIGVFLGCALAAQILWGLVFIAGDAFAPNNILLKSALQRVFFTLVFYFVLGICVGRNWDRLRVHLGRLRLPLLLAGWVILLAVVSSHGVLRIWRSGMKPDQETFRSVPFDLMRTVLHCGTLLLCFKVALLLVSRRSLAARALLAFSSCSYGIYLIHVLFVQFFQDFLKRWGADYDSPAFYIILFPLTVIFSVLTVRLIGLMPKARYLIGERR